MAATNAIRLDISVKPLSSIFRSGSAVLVGLVFVVVLTTATDVLMHATAVFPPFGQATAGSLFLLALAYRTLYGVAGGYITARLALQNPIKHAVVLGFIGFLLGTAGTLATWGRGPEFGPKWYAIAVIVIAVPSSWMGGKLQRNEI
jgi:hypothetical protein